jgi:hypothetical protein
MELISPAAILMLRSLVAALFQRLAIVAGNYDEEVMATATAS